MGSVCLRKPFFGLTRSYRKKSGDSNRRDSDLFPMNTGLPHAGYSPHFLLSQFCYVEVRARPALNFAGMGYT